MIDGTATTAKSTNDNPGNLHVLVPVATEFANPYCYMKLRTVEESKGKSMVDLVSLAIQIIVGVIILSPVLWLVGRAMVGKEKAKVTDAIWIVVLGIVINAILGAYIHGLLGFVVTLIVWVALIHHFFDAGWGKSILIGIIAIIVLVVIVFILALLGFAAVAGLGGLSALGL